MMYVINCKVKLIHERIYKMKQLMQSSNISISISIEVYWIVNLHYINKWSLLYLPEMQTFNAIYSLQNKNKYWLKLWQKLAHQVLRLSVKLHKVNTPHFHSITKSTPFRTKLPIYLYVIKLHLNHSKSCCSTFFCILNLFSVCCWRLPAAPLFVLFTLFIF